MALRGAPPEGARLAEAISPTLDLPTGAEELVRDVILGLAPVLRL